MESGDTRSSDTVQSALHRHESAGVNDDKLRAGNNSTKVTRKTSIFAAEEHDELYDESGDKLKHSAFNEKTPFDQAKILFRAALLCFNAGYINAITLQSGRLVTSHMTGHVTQFAIYLSEFDKSGMEVRFSLMLSFTVGGFISGCTLETGKPFDHNYSYGPVLFIQMVVTLLASLVGHWYPDSDWFYYLAAAACGIQNGISSVYTSNLIRSTHMSGICTDTGLHVGRWMRGHYVDSWKLQIFFTMFVSFLFGGVAAGFEFQEWKTDSFIFSAVFLACLLLLDIWHVRYRYGTLAKAYGFSQ